MREGAETKFSENIDSKMITLKEKARKLESWYYLFIYILASSIFMKVFIQILCNDLSRGAEIDDLLIINSLNELRDFKEFCWSMYLERACIKDICFYYYDSFGIGMPSLSFDLLLFMKNLIPNLPCTVKILYAYAKYMLDI